MVVTLHLHSLLFPLPRPHPHPRRAIFNGRLPRVSFPFLLPNSPLTSWSSSMASEGVAAEKTSAPYGSWRSAITADVVAGAEKQLGGFAVCGDGRLLWIETRPSEGGREVIVKEPEKLEDKPLDVIPSEFSARTLAQEYGGGAFAVRDNVVVFSNYEDQRLYKQIIGGNHTPIPLTPDYGGSVVRYADGIFDPLFHRFITVMEDHRSSSLNPTTTIVAIHLSNEDIHEPKVLLSGNDFYAFPRVDPSGKRIAWVEWSHPNMHWDKAELWVGYVSESGDLCKRVCVAGGDPLLVESPTEPKWSSKGELLFMTDRRTGYWNIYKWIEDKNDVVPVYPMNAEFARPLWVYGACSYDFVGRNGENNSIICSYRQSGRSYLGILDYVSGSFSLLDVPLSLVANVVAGSDYFYVEGASATHPLSIAKVTLDEMLSKATAFSIVWSSSPDVTKYKPYFSLPELVKFPTEIPGQNAYAYFYPPTNPSYQGLSDEKPPLLVETHGYGREYRERLLGQWGVVDVNDSCSCATYLVESGKVDGQRLCVTGESAGGYTTLACLAFRDAFKAGASLYGVRNERDYFEKSPINFVDKFTCPVVLFQGLDDKIVPPDQARKIYTALKEKGLPVALVEYEGEQHGFRKAENIKFTLEQAMVFFARLVGRFEVADDITPIKIDNID
ncbi:putative peptidase YuxL [Ananas comosus]|uniref:Putative peptidase YuxL n=1 Tax=Ananas comosus TaxID=4615 RepID=A0A199V2U0_ANACO|nr:putative peptidase YuxL [Ananas comosus]